MDKGTSELLGLDIAPPYCGKVVLNWVSPLPCWDDDYVLGERSPCLLFTRVIRPGKENECGEHARGSAPSYPARRDMLPFQNR